MTSTRPLPLICGFVLFSALVACQDSGPARHDVIPGIGEYPVSAVVPPAGGVVTGSAPPAEPVGGSRAGPRATVATTTVPGDGSGTTTSPTSSSPGPAAPPGATSTAESSSTPHAPSTTVPVPETTTPTGDIPGGPYRPE
ncbi:hypothetical protein [Saccharothrix longispora]|uniref:hypothetical protein n=1 Tax=Saccharothrix longispora TaxID=33920 RepID=UPI0028FD7BEF|nr:hypothetical protein [Saccharothrix longispora]MDU0290024.1 hypothetical protein [Saccharothrix longispora]